MRKDINKKDFPWDRHSSILYLPGRSGNRTSMPEKQLIDTPLEGISSTNYTLSAYRLFQVSLVCALFLAGIMLYFWNKPEPDLLIVQFLGFLYFLICLTSLAGTVFGYLSFRKKELSGLRKKLGLVGNGLLFLLFLCLIVYSLIAFPVPEIEH